MYKIMRLSIWQNIFLCEFNGPWSERSVVVCYCSSGILTDEIIFTERAADLKAICPNGVFFVWDT